MLMDVKCHRERNFRRFVHPLSIQSESFIFYMNLFQLCEHILCSSNNHFKDQHKISRVFIYPLLFDEVTLKFKDETDIYRCIFMGYNSNKSISHELIPSDITQKSMYSYCIAQHTHNKHIQCGPFTIYNAFALNQL